MPSKQEVPAGQRALGLASSMQHSYGAKPAEQNPPQQAPVCYLLLDLQCGGVGGKVFPQKRGSPRELLAVICHLPVTAW